MVQTKPGRKQNIKGKEFFGPWLVAVPPEPRSNCVVNHARESRKAAPAYQALHCATNAGCPQKAGQHLVE